MSIAVAILTHNAVTNGRLELLADAYETLAREADDVVVVNNGSNDETAEWIADQGWTVVHNIGRITTSGAGTNMQAYAAESARCDLCVLSDDDMHWHAGWAQRLADAWKLEDDHTALIGCHLEPLFAWNTITGRGHDILYRASTGAASWSFRSGTWATIGPVPHRRQGWSDVPACMSLIDRGYRIGQMDLAEHRGTSTWGNGSSSFDEQGIARVRAFLNETKADSGWQLST